MLSLIAGANEIAKLELVGDERRIKRRHPAGASEASEWGMTAR
jgi:hypothetical protein